MISHPHPQMAVDHKRTIEYGQDQSSVGTSLEGSLGF